MKVFPITKKLLIFLFFLLIILKVPILGSDLSTEEKETKAKEFFNNKKYSEAIPLYEQLIKAYPKESSYNYFLGCCYLYTNTNIKSGIDYLRLAASRNYSSDVYYYLAKAYYLNAQYARAEVSLGNFKNFAKKRTLQELNADELQSLIEAAKNEDLKEDKISLEKATLNKERKEDGPKKANNLPSASKQAVGVASVSKPLVKSEKKEAEPLKSITKYSEYELVLNKALKIQLECDSLQTKLLQMENDYRNSKTIEQKNPLKAEIIFTEQLIIQEQAKADKLFLKAQELHETMNIEGVSEEENQHVVLDKEINDIKVFTYKPNKTSKDSTGASDIDAKKAGLVNSSAAASKFEILSFSPYNENKPIPENVKIPDGLIYRIQLGAFSQKKPSDNFGGLSPLSIEYIKERELYKYFVGFFKSSKQAHEAVSVVKGHGYSDAFLVSYYDKKKISINEAREIEFGQKLNTD